MNFDQLTIGISADSCIVDTNLLIGLFRKNDQHSEQANEFIEAFDEYVFYVPVPVVVETWGSLVGGVGGNFDSGFKFLDWLQGTNVVVLPEFCKNLDLNASLMRKMNVDIVDALILDLADDITKVCALSSPMLIATFDTKDFYKLLNLKAYRFRLLDLRTFQIEGFN